MYSVVALVVENKLKVSMLSSPSNYSTVYASRSGRSISIFLLKRAVRSIFFPAQLIGNVPLFLSIFMFKYEPLDIIGET